MESKKIRALLTAAESGSLTAAAAELGYTQAGLTQMMNAVENELGVELLVRSKSGVRLSADGQALLSEMRAFVKAADALERSAQRQREESRSLLRIGAYSSISRQWLPAVLSDFRRAVPGTDTHVSVYGIEQMYAFVRNGALDCAFVSRQPSLMGGLVWHPLRVDELLAVLPPTHPLPGGDFPLEAFDGTDFLMPSLGFEMDIDPLFTALPRRVMPRIQTTNMDDTALVSMVEHGLGLTILSRLVLRDMTASVAVLPLRPRGYRSLGLIVSSRRRDDEILQRFITTARSTVDAMYPGREENIP